jgi:hypothetical protein
VATDADGGAMLTVTLLTIVADADATSVPAVAWMIAGFVAGRSAGAVKVAVVALVTAMVPFAELPPGIPFTSQMIVVLFAAQKDAVKTCVRLKPTLAAEGEIRIGFAHVMVTVALPDFVGSAVLVAVTVTDAGDGIKIGAV